ncbi:MAG: Ada metal-binding domain-containing protein [Candidatus Ornithomonoglobus sp.]
MKKLLILLTLSFALSGCTAKVPQTEYDALATEKATLVEQVETLTNEKEELSAQIEELTSENNNLKADNQKLLTENEKLKATPVPTAIPEAKNLNVDKSVSTSASSSSSGSSAAASSGSSGSGSTQYAYIGNKNSYKFHRTSCSTLPNEANRVYFATREEAVNAGMVPCKKCNP